MVRKAVPDNCKLLLDPAVGNVGDLQIPLFRGKKSQETEFSNVDLLIINKQNKISVIIEIEESDIKPTQICGKFLTSALSTCYFRGGNKNDAVPMAKNVLFVQVIDRKLIPEGSAKGDQFRILKREIRKILPVKKSHVTKYNLFCIDWNKPDGEIEEFKSCILKHLENN